MIKKYVARITIAIFTSILLNFPTFTASAQDRKKQHTHQEKPPARNIKKITNTITKNDIGYYKAFSWHYPKHFTLKVNGNKIAPGDSIELKENTITIQYDYEWWAPWGNQIGSKKVTYEIPVGVDEIPIKFGGWDEKERTAIPQAKKVSEETALACPISFSPDDVY